MENDIQVLGVHVCPVHRVVKDKQLDGTFVCPECKKK
jgi:hypothetical protein